MDFQEKGFQWPGLAQSHNHRELNDYRLFSVIYHNGDSASAGHYAIATKIGRSWVMLNDEKISVIRDLSSGGGFGDAVMLTYCRKDKYDDLIGTYLF